MGSELATIDVRTYLAISEGGAVGEALAANLGTGSALRESDLTRIKTPAGGGTMWMIPGLTGDEPAKTIEGILVYQTVRGIVWLSDEPQEGSLPALVSADLRTAKIVASDLPQSFLDLIEPAHIDGTNTYDWSLLPQNAWGSGKGGAGKAGKEQRVLYILRKDEPLPVVVTVQPGSLRGWQDFIMALTKAGIPYYRAVVSLSLQKQTSKNGQPYAEIVPSLVGTLTPEQGVVIKEKFSTPMAAIAASCFSS